MSELHIRLKKLRYNINWIKKFCTSKGLEVVGIVKGCSNYFPIMEACYQNGIEIIGISRVDVGIKAYSHLAHRPMLISVPSIKETDRVVRYFQISLNSEIEVIKALAESARQMSQRHEIILMVDNGDLREGVMPEAVLPMVRNILELKAPNLKFLGLGANLGCCSGVLPNAENISILQELALEIERRYSHPVEKVSVGGSVMLDWMENHELPSKINQIRIGEAMLLGNIPTVNRKHKSLCDDVFIFKGEVLEVKEKPSLPAGVIGTDALGHAPAFVDRGVRKRALLNFGVVDTYPLGLQPIDSAVQIISVNSDYTIADVTDCYPPVRVGTVLEFKLNYKAMIQSFLSPFVKCYIE